MTMTNLLVLAAVIVAAAFTAGFLVGAAHALKVHAIKGAAYMVPIPGQCTRCQIKLKSNSVMFVPKIPGPGQLYCRSCFELIKKKLQQHEAPQT